MTPDEIKETLAQTLHDRRLSRGERSALNRLADDHDWNDHERALYRSICFDLAREELHSPRAREVLDWAESVVKLLQPTQRSSNNHIAEAFFSPDDDCHGQIIRLLNQADRSVDICVFTITDNRVSEAIRKAHRRGVTIRIVSDNDKSEDKGSDIESLASQGIPIRCDETRNHMHHKFAIFDAQLLLTGSYNWTRSAAAYNEENFLVTSQARLVKPFMSEFEKLWKRYA